MAGEEYGDEEKEQSAGLRSAIENLLDDWDYLFRLINTIDWDAQLEAIRSLFRQHRAWPDSVSANIARLKNEAETYRGPYHDHLVDEHVNAMFRSSYSDGVISLSAMGVIVPMIETVFSQSFQSLGAKYAVTGLTPPDHQRWRRAEGHAEAWNCQWHFGRRDPRLDITAGIPQLSDAAGLAPFLPADALDWIVALLTFRNRMFHGGLEWSIGQRNQFEKLIEQRKWDRYFVAALSNDRPWIFYLRDEMIDELPDRMNSLLDAFGRFARSLQHELVSVDQGDNFDVRS